MNDVPGCKLIADGCTQLFGDPTLTAALLDRLTHKAHIVMCDWDSYRLKESLKKKSPAKRDKE